MNYFAEIISICLFCFGVQYIVIVTLALIYGEDDY